MLDRKKAIKRHYIVGDKYYEGEYHEFMDVPNLIENNATLRLLTHL